MIITLCNNFSELNKINKNISAGIELSGTLRDKTNVINPDILIEIENPTGYNYCHIPSFGRYYYIADMQSVRTGLWRIMLKVDVLMSFKAAIMGVPIILSNSENIGADNYLSDNVWKSKVKKKTDIISFSGGLLDSGEFILITAGGGA